MGLDPVGHGTPWMDIKSTSFKEGDVTLRAYQISDQNGEDEVVYKVINTYTGKSIFSLTRMFAEWVYGACEENLILECMGALA